MFVRRVDQLSKSVCVESCCWFICLFVCIEWLLVSSWRKQPGDGSMQSNQRTSHRNISSWRTGLLYQRAREEHAGNELFLFIHDLFCKKTNHSLNHCPLFYHTHPVLTLLISIHFVLTIIYTSSESF